MRRSRRPRPAALLPGLALTAVVAVIACGPKGPLSPPENYEEYCARCHGDDGRGDPKMVRLKPELDLVGSAMVQEGDFALVRQRIADGEGTMPGFAKKITPEELEALTAWTIETFGAREGKGDGQRSTGPPS